MVSPLYNVFSAHSKSFISNISRLVGFSLSLSFSPRLDAGSFGTMGLGCGYAIAAALIEQRKPDGQRSPVVAIQGDSAFGFSGMELETASRYWCSTELSKRKSLRT